MNVMCQHLVPYAEYGQRKRDFPAHFTPLNPWINHSFKELNDYFTELGYLLGNSQEIINVAVLHPIRCAYLYFKRDDDLNCFGIKDLEESFVALRKILNDEQIPYHLIDETILEKYGAAENGQLICGKCKYNFLILPKIYTMGKETEKILREYVASGGKNFLYDKLPEYLEGENTITVILTK
ncbi:MAG: hypothetical protein ACI4SH_08160 [Candidatus Scatosoma sp.]